MDGNFVALGMQRKLQKAEDEEDESSLTSLVLRFFQDIRQSIKAIMKQVQSAATIEDVHVIRDSIQLDHPWHKIVDLSQELEDRKAHIHARIREPSQRVRSKSASPAPAKSQGTLEDSKSLQEGGPEK